MTREPGRTLGPLGRRLVLAFSAVSLVAVVLLALAAQQAVDRGLVVSREAGLWTLAHDVAGLAAGAYRSADGWAQADLAACQAAADDAGARLTITDLDGTVVLGRSTGSGAPHTGGTAAPVTVDGAQVGTVTVGYQGGSAAGAAARAEAAGRDLAWSWILGAAALALGLAVVAGWLVTRWLTAPLTALTRVARSFAAGDRSARADDRATGELGDLARGFNEAADAVERNAAARRQMAADVAHELRTPLAALQAGLEELRDGLVPADPAAIDRLHAQSVRLGRVVADLGVLASIDDQAPGSVHGRCDLAEVVRSELAARGPELRAAGMVIATGEVGEAQVIADTDRMHQVVGNLLANCARHCRPGDTVTVTLADRGDQVVLMVTDDGPGIAPEDLPHVLDRYRRGARSGGSGLGLAVVDEIVSAHRGTVEVRSPAEDGVGTTVEVRLRSRR